MLPEVTQPLPSAARRGPFLDIFMGSSSCLLGGGESRKSNKPPNPETAAGVVPCTCKDVDLGCCFKGLPPALSYPTNCDCYCICISSADWPLPAPSSSRRGLPGARLKTQSHSLPYFSLFGLICSVSPSPNDRDLALKTLQFCNCRLLQHSESL